MKKEIARIQQEYVKITTAEQKMSYAAEFERDYDEYVKLKRREKEVTSRLFLHKETNYNLMVN